VSYDYTKAGSTFTLTEVFTFPEGFDAHGKAPHMQPFRDFKGKGAIFPPKGTKGPITMGEDANLESWPAVQKEYAQVQGTSAVELRGGLAGASWSSDPSS